MAFVKLKRIYIDTKVEEAVYLNTNHIIQLLPGKEPGRCIAVVTNGNHQTIDGPIDGVAQLIYEAENQLRYVKVQGRVVAEPPGYGIRTPGW